MKIEKISYCNMDKLLNVIISGQNTEGGKCSLGRNFINLLNHVQITLEISDVKILDFYFLKKYCSGAISLKASYLTTDSIGDSENLKKLKETTDKLISVVDEINHDGEIEVKPGEMLFPAIAQTVDCYVTFFGRDLTTIMDTPELFFRRVFGIQNADIHENVEYPESLKGYEEKMDNVVIETFLDGFYKSENHVLENYDLLTDSSMKTGYYDYVEYGKALLLHVNTPAGCLNFVGKEAVNIARQMEVILPKLKVLDKKDIYLHLSIKSSLAGFFEMTNRIPMTMITDTEDFKALLKSDKYIDIKGLEKYHFRLSKRLEEMNTLKNEVINDPVYGLSRFHFIPLNSLYSYSIRASLYEIEEVFGKLQKELKEVGVKTCVSEELRFITESIFSMHDIIENYNK